MLAPAVLAVPPMAAASAAPPARWHFSYASGLELSVFFRRNSARDETRLLVKAPGGRFVLVSTQDAASRTSAESIRSLDENETFSRRLILAGVKSEPACAGVKRLDACVLFAGKNGSVTAGLSSFAGKAETSVRARAAALPSGAMRRRLFSLARLLPTSQELSIYGPDFLALVWPEIFGARKALVPGIRTPGCEFDADFGFPCSPEERAREERRFAPRRP